MCIVHPYPTNIHMYVPGYLVGTLFLSCTCWIGYFVRELPRVSSAVSLSRLHWFIPTESDFVLVFEHYNENREYPADRFHPIDWESKWYCKHPSSKLHFWALPTLFSHRNPYGKQLPRLFLPSYKPVILLAKYAFPSLFLFVCMSV